MKRLLPLALLLVGCATTPEPTPTPETKPVATQTTPVAPVPSDINPNRAFQLKDLEKVDIDLKGKKVHLWVMDTPNKQGEGMMFLKDGDVKADEGMLFAFYQVQPKVRQEDGQLSGFWMHNTLIPLDIIYFSPAGKVVNIVHGKKEDDTSLPANADYQNVIELKDGTAARLGLKIGDTVTIPKLGKPPELTP